MGTYTGVCVGFHASMIFPRCRSSDLESELCRSSGGGPSGETYDGK